MKNFKLNFKSIVRSKARWLLTLIAILTLGVGQMWAADYNNQTFVYLKQNNGTTYYYQVSSASWDVSASLPDTWGGALPQTLTNVHNLQLKGGAVGGWTSYGDQLSGTLSYKITENSTTPSSGWTSLGSISNGGSVYQSNSDHCYYYNNGYSTDITPHAPGTYYLHIKISYNSTSKTSYVQFTVPPFTVAGSSAVMGSNWSFSDTNNDMTWSTGTTYTLTKYHVSLSNGTTYEFKVGVNHGSSEAYPASNKTFTVANTGYYNVTFSFDAKTHTVSDASTTRVYKVTYNGNGNTGGSAPSDAYYPSGATVTVASVGGTFAKSNYTFGGWNTANDASGTNYTAGSGTFSKAASTETLYAKWTQGTTIDANGGAADKSYTVAWNATSITIASAPSRTGYNLTGYYKEEGCSNLIANTSKALQASTAYTDASNKWNYTSAAPTLFAGWEAKTYDITLDKNDGSATKSGSATATYDGVLSSITAPTYSGFHVEGYYKEAGKTNKIADGEGVLIANTDYTDANGKWTQDGAVTLYAKWEADAVNYTLTFGVANDPYDDGELAVTAGGSDASSGSEYASGTAIACTATPSTHYRVKGWYEDDDCSSAIDGSGTGTSYNFSLGSDVSVYVGFELSQCTITLNGNGGSDKSVTATHGSVLPSFTGSSRSGYTLTGYWTNTSGGTKIIDASGSLVASTSYADASYKWKVDDRTLTLYAQWTANSYDVALNANGGTGAGVTVSATYGSTMPAKDKSTASLVAPTKAGYTFAGYYDDASSGTKYYNADLTSAHIWDKASTATLYAHWTERLHKKVYFAKPADWTNVYAYVWKDGGSTNATWPGKQLDAATPIAGTGTEVINCATYYYYKYYTDGGSADAEGLVGNSAWDKVIFNNGDNPGVANNTKTSNLNLVSGNAYGVHTSMQSTSADGYATSAKWTLRGSFNSWSSSTYPFSCAEGEHSYSVLVEGLTASTNYSFKIWGPDGVAYKYTGGKDASYDADYSVTSLLDGRDLVLNEYASNNNTFTTATTSYLFTLDVTDPKHPVLTIVPGDDAEYSVTLAVSGHGSITTPGTGSTTIHRYAPTTITAVADPGYRFTGWTKSGTNNEHISIANAGSASTTVTADADVSSATITANFSNDGFVYFDASAVSGFSGGGKVYVTYLQSKALSWDEGEGKTGALIVKNWISDDLHNQEMTRIPNTNIYYFYTSTTPQGKILFTSKSHAGTDYKLWEMAAVVREDFNVGQDNMFVAENWVLKDKNKTGYYDGYWMKYNESDPGVKLCIYSLGSGTPHISGSPFSFTRTEEGSRIYTTSVTGLTANTQYGIEIIGLNDTYYKNSGEMTSTNAVGGWDYVDRQPTRGTIRTTAAGDYDVQLSCADKLILTVDYPLGVNDYKVLYSGKDSVGGSTTTISSSIIRHIGAVGTQKDTISFFVVKGDGWTLQLQKCTAVSPSITWGNVGDAKTAANFGTPETGVYNFVVKQDSATGTPVTPAFATMTPEAYTGNYYIRTDAADGGWEAYKKSMDNRMVFSNYSKQHSDYDYYHCKYKTSGKNVKFCIANDYSGSLSAIKTTDTYVTNGDGNLPAAANIRFMWNSETNVVSRAYLNGSSTTDFLVLAAKNDSIKNADGSSISKSGDYNQVKFEDKNNWVYQKEVQALEGTHVRLTSNYRFGSPESDHLQYFIGSAGDWTPAHTELLIGGTTANSWQNLRLVYDFKTNHLTAAWLPPTTDITTAKHIEADMLLIRTCQNAAQQLTFNGGSVDKVKTMVGAIELRYDSIVGRVGNFNGDVMSSSGNRANRELMYYISFPFDVAVSDIYGFGQLNKEWYLQYYDGAERASKGWFKGDGTTTFWKFMTLSDTLKANVGYSLLLDNDYFNTTGDGTVWNNLSSGSKIYLYFPSAKELSGDSIIASNTKSVTVPSHECTIDRTFVSANSGRTVNHKFTDSHWNMIGVPLFQNQTGVETTKFIAEIESENPQDLIPFPENQGYFYEWDSLANTLSVRSTSGYTFKSMHGYMVQFTGTVEFTGSSIQPASVAARRAQLNKNYTIELQLLQNARQVSRTYVELREEACDTFALNEDMYMLYTSRPADLFTYAGNYDVSANVLSENNHIVPVGIEVHKAGTFTFTMPSNFSGTATLIDTHTQTRTNLAISNYEVTLPKGVCDGRFFLELDINKVTTDVKEVTGDGLQVTGVRKYIYDNQLYIMKNGVIYDARGNRVK